MSCRLLIVLIVSLSSVTTTAAEPSFQEGKNIFIETGVEAPDRTPTWYASMMDKPYTPVFEMLAMQGTQGRYYPYTYPVTLKDLIKFHGHD